MPFENVFISGTYVSFKQHENTKSKKEKYVQKGMIFPAACSTMRKQSVSCAVKNGFVPGFSKDFLLNDHFSTELN